MGKFKSAANWCFGNYDKLLQIGGLAVSFLAPAWAAYASPFMSQYQPLSWVVAGFAGIVIAIVAYWLWAVAYGKFVTAKMTAAIMERSGVNPLDDRFERKTIQLIDFYRPQYVSHKNKDFRNCEVRGPGLVYFGNVSMIGCEFKHVQIVIVAENQIMWGMTTFENPRFVDCAIMNITMMMNKATYLSLPQDLRNHVPIINGQFP